LVRGIQRGRVSAGGAPFIDPGDDEVLLGYPFSGGDLIGPQGNGGLTTPLVLVQQGQGPVLALSSLDNRVRTKRFYFLARRNRLSRRSACRGGRLESRALVPCATLATHAKHHVAAAADAHYDHLAGAFHIPRWDTRTDSPDWLRRTALVVTLHGMHFSGYVFNDYARMLVILKWMATRMPAGRVLVFLASGTADTTGTIRCTGRRTAWAAKRASAR
jgi:hypothetical protein